MSDVNTGEESVEKARVRKKLPACTVDEMMGSDDVERAGDEASVDDGERGGDADVRGEERVRDHDKSAFSEDSSFSTSMASRPPTRPPHPNTVLDTHHGRVLCIADIRGHLSVLNDLAREHNAVAIIHTGDLGFFGLS